MQPITWRWNASTLPHCRGADCTLEDGTTVARRGEVHVACSPEEEGTHLLVWEPRACSYVFTLFTPAFCGERSANRCQLIRVVHPHLWSPPMPCLLQSLSDNLLSRGESLTLWRQNHILATSSSL